MHGDLERDSVGHAELVPTLKIAAPIERNPLPFADISFGELLLIALEIFFFVIWIWILITILTDLFRDHELSGWSKAAWVLFLVFIPFLTALVYLIARGAGMRDRTIKAQAEAKQHFDSYIRQQAHIAYPADE